MYLGKVCANATMKHIMHSVHMYVNFKNMKMNKIIFFTS